MPIVNSNNPTPLADALGGMTEATGHQSIDPLDNEAINKTASVFKSGIHRVKYMVEVMPKKSVSRVYSAFLEFPLGNEYPTFRDKMEQELFNLTLECIDAKNKMIEVSLKYHEQQAQLRGDNNG